MNFKEKQKEVINSLSSYLDEKKVNILHMAFSGAGIDNEKCSIRKLFNKQKNNLEKIFKKEIKTFDEFIDTLEDSYDTPVIYSVVSIPTEKKTVTSLIYGFSLEDLLYRIKIISDKLQKNERTNRQN